MVLMEGSFREERSFTAEGRVEDLPGRDSFFSPATEFALLCSPLEVTKGEVREDGVVSCGLGSSLFPAEGLPFSRIRMKRWCRLMTVLNVW